MNMQLDPHVKAVFDDIVAHTPDIGPTPSGDVVNLGTAPSNNGRHWLAVAAAAIVVVGVGALVAIQRPNSDTPDVAPATQLPAPVADLGPGGALVFDQTPAALQNVTVSVGNRFELATSDKLAGTTEVPVLVRRWYTSNTTQPELAVWIAVDSFPADRMVPDTPSDAEDVTVQGVDGHLYDTPLMEGRSVAFTVGDTGYILAADHVTDTDLLLAAGHVRAAEDGYGGIISPAGLTNGLTERAAGTMFETFFISREALGHPIPQTHWDASDRSVWVSALTEDPALVPLHRLGYATVTDTTVHGQPAYLTTLGDFQPEYRGVTWSAGGVTYLLGSNSFDDNTVIEYANLLRPATTSEWDQLVQDTLRRTAEQQSQAVATTIPTEPSLPTITNPDLPNPNGDELGSATEVPEGPISTFDALDAGERRVVVDNDDVAIVARYETTTTAPYCVDLSLGGFTGPACGDRQAWADLTTFGIVSGDGSRKLVGQIVPDTISSVTTSDGRTITPISNVWWDVAPINSTITYVVHATDGRSTEPFAAVVE